MKTEWRIFGIVSVFLFGASAFYLWWTTTATGHPELVGGLALLLSALLCLMCGGYFWFVSRRIDPRPEDREDGEIQDGAGDIGFFSPGSYWPFGAALATAITVIGVAYFTIWLILIGVVAVLLAAGGWLFEYYTGTRRGLGH